MPRVVIISRGENDDSDNDKNGQIVNDSLILTFKKRHRSTTRYHYCYYDLEWRRFLPRHHDLATQSTHEQLFPDQTHDNRMFSM